MRPTRAGSAGKRRGTVLDAAGERSGPRRRVRLSTCFCASQAVATDIFGGKLGFWEDLIKVKRRETDCGNASLPHACQASCIQKGDRHYG